MALKIGMELEGHLIDGTGTLSNRASEVIGDSRNNGDIIPELSKTMWEIIAPPKYKLSDVYNSFKDILRLKNIGRIITLYPFDFNQSGSTPKFLSVNTPSLFSVPFVIQDLITIVFFFSEQTLNSGFETEEANLL